MAKMVAARRDPIRESISYLTVATIPASVVPNTKKIETKGESKGSSGPRIDRRSNMMWGFLRSNWKSSSHKSAAGARSKNQLIMRKKRELDRRDKNPVTVRRGERKDAMNRLNTQGNGKRKERLQRHPLPTAFW